MTTATSWISKMSGRCGGRACVRDSRITVWGLVRWRQLGLSDDEIMLDVQGVTLADLEAAFEYYAANKEEIDCDIAENEAGEEGTVNKDGSVTPFDPPPDMQERFLKLAAQWHKETGMLSSPTKKFAHPAYQRIVDMGEVAVPLILRDLRDHSGYWFRALRALTKQNPVTEADKASFERTRQAWLNWGKERGILE